MLLVPTTTGHTHRAGLSPWQNVEYFLFTVRGNHVEIEHAGGNIGTTEV